MRSAAALAVMLAALSLAACEQKKPDDPAQSDPRAANPAKYDRDISDCREQVSEYMRKRRVIDDSRAGVFAGDRDRYGQGALPTQMQAYGETRSSDAMVADCMEAHGWSRASRQWWQKIGEPHTF
ncbi:MAG: hypothetical protein JOY81_04595 [Alphaproteobacteria bacterium]|nr:hypothetical protein [Alphaproteobacteria bacterium]